ncbi:MAG: Smr/MutS family protein [Gemmatimonadetes bacterium]|nr:Smr/MutS family protein [Gemmatimonadota bacterium]
MICRTTSDELEFGEALSQVAKFAVSEVGAEAVRARRPMTSTHDVGEELAAVAELADLLRDGDQFSPVAIPDIRSVLEQLRIPGSVLEGTQLTQLGEVIQAVVRLAADLARIRRDNPRVAALAVDPPPADVGKRLSDAIDVDGSVKDRASKDLARARRAVRIARERLIKLLDDVRQQRASIVAAGDAVVTMRGGRYVIPVRREARSRVRGIVHGESGSGATLFVEPEEAVPLGNELGACEAAEGRAVLQVLRELTDLARPHADLVEDGWGMCIRVDDLYARARYTLEVDAHLPAVVAAPAPLTIRQGHHPLLLAELDTVVPFDLHTEADERVVVVSGPNTGGKTVLLKAVGLINVMAQAGVIPPVGKGTTLPVFTMIFADIGDHQSITESLSTFSAHLRALKDVLESADDRSLVLLDEFGTGTDPSEGAALAGAVLRTLCERGGLTIATTHLNQLKRLAAETPGAVNASLQFDAERLQPTYRIVKGVPGRSYGLAIARQLGFPDRVLAVAEELLPDSERSMEALLADLEGRDRAVARRESEAESQAARLAAEQDGLAQLRDDLLQRAKTLEEERHRLEATGREDARQFLLDARKRVEQALGMAQAAVSETTAKEVRRLVEEGVQQEASALEKLEMEARKKGWTIRGGRPGPKPDVSRPIVGRNVKRRAGPDPDRHEAGAAAEVDLRGLLADDAETTVLRALDDAVVAGLTTLRIIHGKGTGVLRQRVSVVLGRDARVQSFGSPPSYQGGWGVTVAELTS